MSNRSLDMTPTQWEHLMTFDNAAFSGHELVQYCADPETGLRAIIAIHDTRLGPALGALAIGWAASRG